MPSDSPIFRWSSGLLPRLKQWSSDRASEQQTGERLLEEQDYPAAELHLAHALVECEKRQEQIDKRILLRLELSEAQRHQLQKLPAAEQTAREALELARRTADRGLHLQCVDALAAILAECDRAPEAERLNQEAAELEAKLRQRDPLQAVRRAHRLGSMRQRMGNVTGAVDALSEVAATYEKLRGLEHLDSARAYSELGVALSAVPNYAEAQRCFRLALRAHEVLCGIESAEAAADLRQLTAVLEAAGDLQGASQQWERSLMLQQRVVGGDMDRIAEIQSELAKIYLRWRNNSRARELMMEAVGTFKRKSGPRLALAYEALAEVEELSGHYPQALAELNRAGKVWESMQAEHSEEWMKNLERRAALFDLLRQPKEAAFLREKLIALRQAGRWAAAG